MKKKIISDIVLKKGNLSPPSSGMLKRGESFRSALYRHEVPKRAENKVVTGTPKIDAKRFLSNKIIWLSLLGVALASVLFFGISSFFSGATIAITPKKSELPLNLSLNAKRAGTQSILFEITRVKGSEAKTVASSGERRVERKASGRIVIYNSYSESPQKLVASTRFSSADGKIYRISKDITVPGLSIKNGETFPGSIEVPIYADKVGAEYNIGLTDFSIPGFKGDPRYEKFFARSKTEISGGFSGITAVASDEDMTKTASLLKDSLKDDLFREAETQVPQGYILYKDATEYQFSAPKEESVANSSEVSLRIEGSLTGVLLRREDVESEISRAIKSSIGTTTVPFSITTIDKMSFAFKGLSKSLSPEINEISFNLSGPILFEYTVDEEALKKDLAKSSKKEFQLTLAKYPAVYKARIVSLRPFWSGVFPKDFMKIGVTTERE